jgi:hypothetical protein
MIRTARMKLPQFQLRRLFAAITLFGLALMAWSRVAAPAIEQTTGFLLIVLGLTFFGAACGTPFRKGLVGAVSLPLGLLLMISVALFAQLFMVAGAIVICVVVAAIVAFVASELFWRN